MNRGRSVFAQLLDFVPFAHFEHLVDRFSSNHGIKHFSAWNHFLCIAYSQLTRREGLRDLVACLNSHRSKLYHLGIRGKVSRSTLAEANERRDWQLFEALGRRLIATAVDLYQGEDTGLGLKEPLYAMDSTTIDLCLTLFPWADFRSTKAAVKAHTIIDLRGAIPVFVHITSGKVHDVNVLDIIHWPAGAIVVIDRGYMDFERLYSLHQRQVCFVIRAKDNLRYTWIASREVDKATGLRVCRQDNDESLGALFSQRERMIVEEHLDIGAKISTLDRDTRSGWPGGWSDVLNHRACLRLRSRRNAQEHSGDGRDVKRPG